MTEEAFLIADGDRFIPNPISRGFWSPTSVHGRVAIGLLGQEIERRHGSADLLPTRLTVDLYSMVTLAPLEVVTKVVRESGRLRVVDAELICEGKSVARATCQMLKRTEAPEGKVWSPAPWTAPDPATMEPGEQPRHGLWETRRIAGQPGSPAPKQTWMREKRELVAGVPLTPFVRVAVAADYTSPLSHIGDAGVKYINTDVTVYLHRGPVGAWVGFDVTDHGATDGIAVGECRLYDEQGPIGFASYAALANQPRKRTR